MLFRKRRLNIAIAALAVYSFAALAQGQSLQIPKRKADPYGTPRPAPGQVNVPLRTSLFFEVAPDPKSVGDRILSNTLTVSLATQGGPSVDIVAGEADFAPGYSGSIVSNAGWNDTSGIVRVNIESDHALPPSTTCTLRVTAKSSLGGELPASEGTWSFFTESAPSTNALSSTVDFGAPPVKWTGGFFTGICWGGVDPEMAEGYQKIADVHKKFPRSWNLHRVGTSAGFDFQPGFMPGRAPNIVRELETRRIAAIEPEGQGMRLRIEDFIGHEQYDIPSNRPVSADYHHGDEVLIADGVNSTRTMVVSADDATRSVLVQAFEAPVEGWKIAYAAKAPTAKDLGIPGVFPAGGCYLRKFNPVGTPHYYWKRMDQEWDVMWKQYGRRPIAGFDQGPGDLSIDGREYNTAKDYAQLHEVVRAITSHAIERYGEDCLKFYWSIFNEPDLMTAYWRSRDWIELQKFYDYSTDAILRAFEDHGMDSKKVIVGGLELGAIFGKNVRASEFLYHCSPTTAILEDKFTPNMIRKSTLQYNAAFADKRLDGKRSKRVEELCRENDGRGAPCDFLSVHCYNGAQLSAEKMIGAKKMALEIDPNFFQNLLINTHEACPSWSPPPDKAASDSYLGDGYFETWCADVAHRLLSKAAEDPRYAFGESILTFWGFPAGGFQGMNAGVHSIPVDKNGDGIVDRKDIILMPIINYLALMCSIGPDYWVIPAETANGHRVGGFASRSEKEIRVMLYDHNEGDPQSRSDQAFGYALDLRGTGWEKAQVQEYRFDKHSNSFYESAHILRDKPVGAAKPTAESDPAIIAKIIQGMESGNRRAQMKAIKQLEKLGPSGADALPAVMKIAFTSKDEKLKSAAMGIVQRIANPTQSYSPAELKPVYEAQNIRTTATHDITVGADGSLRIDADLSSNGTIFLVIAPKEQKS